MTIMSKTVQDYLREKTDDKDTKFVQMACPFSLRPPPKHLGDYTFDNKFAIVNLNLRLVDNLKEGVKVINRDMQGLKNSIEPIGLYYLILIVMSLPSFVRWYVLEDYVSKMTFGFSNVPGPREPYIVDGKVNHGIGFNMPVGRSMVGSFSIISHVNMIKVCISMDKSVMESPKIISDMFLKNMDEMLGESWRDFHKARNS